MNKKEISEIKKQFTPENCSLTASADVTLTEKRIKKTELERSISLFIKKKKLFKITLKFSANPFPEQ